jgi:hypothetical protein
MGGNPAIKKFNGKSLGNVTTTYNWRVATNGTVEVNGNTYENVTIKRIRPWVNRITVRKSRYPRGMILIRSIMTPNNNEPMEIFGDETQFEGLEDVIIPDVNSNSPATFVVFMEKVSPSKKIEQKQQYLKEREEKIKQIHEFQNELRNNKKIIN